MKVVVLAGGLGTRLSEETDVRPKPMVEIGERPVLWHILKYYGHYNFDEFYIALGYKGIDIKRYFLEYYSCNGSLTISLAQGSVDKVSQVNENWLLHLMETGRDTNTGGRLKRLQPYLSDGTFMLTYGDGLSNVDLNELLSFHRAHGKLATITAVRPPARFGGLYFDGDLVSEFTEKPQTGEGWINGGFAIFEPEVFKYLDDNDCSLESAVLHRLAEDRQLAAYKHEGFWQCMDTLRDKKLLEQLWREGRAPWKLW